MGAMEKFLKLMNLSGRDEDEEYGEDDDDGYEEAPKNESEPDEPEQPEEPKESKVKIFEKEKKRETQTTYLKKRTDVNDMTPVCIFQPKSYDEAREIANTLLENKIIIMNFEGVDISIAQRVLDIVTGTCIAIDGKLQKMSNSIFIAAPKDVDISGDLLASQMDI